MKAKSRQSAVTLTEMTVVIASVALLVGLGLPAIRAFHDSFESRSGARSMISAALASARAIAAKEQRYAGIRFQKAYHPQGPLEADQYMVFIIQDPEIGAWFFRAVEGLQPIKLPDSVGVMDLTIVIDRNTLNPANSEQVRLDDPSLSPAQKDNLLDRIPVLIDISTFSIIFTPMGKLVIHGIRVVNRDGIRDYPSYPELSQDDIFNKKTQVDTRIAMFYQDDYFGDNAYPDFGLGPEPSRRSFIIYERDKFRQAYEKQRAWSDYLVNLAQDAIYINPYTGTMIER